MTERIDTCPTCGAPVVVTSSPEGTSFYTPVETEADRLRAENAELRESRDAWRLQAMREHDRP